MNAGRACRLTVGRMQIDDVNYEHHPLQRLVFILAAAYHVLVMDDALQERRDECERLSIKRSLL